MKIIIYGAGSSGYCLARYFSNRDQDVTIIDEDPQKIENAHNTLDVEAICGRGSYPDLLEKIGASTADIFIAATDQDELNMIACQIGGSLFDISTKIAYIRDENYLQKTWDTLYHPPHLSIDHIISPETNITQFIANTLGIIGLRVLIPINASTSVIGVRCMESSPLAHKEVQGIQEILPDFPFNLIYIGRQDQHFIPTAEDIILPQDELLFVGNTALIKKMHGITHAKFKVPESILVLGAGEMGYNLIKELRVILPDANLKVIEKSPENARRIVDEFLNVIVLQGNGLDASLLSEANISQMDAVISMMPDNESNILACLLAKSLGAQWTSSLIDNSMYAHLLPSLGIDSLIHSQAITLSEVLRAIRKGTNFKGIYILPETYDEISVGHVRPTNSHLLHKPFSLFLKPGQVLLGGVIREEEFFIPHPEDLIQADDLLILVISSKEVERVQNLF